MSEHENHQGTFLFWFFLGGIIGALVIFFLGTKEGKKYGRLIQKRGEDVLDDVHESIEDLEKKGKELVKQGEEIKEHVIEHLEEKKEDLSHEATKRLDHALAQVEELQEQGAHTTASLRKRLFRNLPKKS